MLLNSQLDCVDETVTMRNKNKRFTELYYYEHSGMVGGCQYTKLSVPIIILGKY